VAAAQQALKPFKQSLQGALKEGLSKGPTEAIKTCNTVAPSLPEKASSEAITVGRTTTKLRSPANAPKEWMKPVLASYAAGTTSAPYQTVKLSGGTLGYAEPIFVQPMCLTCHGDPEKIDPAIKKVLAEKYPKDQATGYQAGDFRGLFWAEVKPLANK
jgi:hypothetical protein